MAKITRARRVDSYTNRYLDAVIERLKLPSDYALADVLGVTTQAIYKLRAGGTVSTTTAAKIAELLDIEPLRVIAETELERGSDQELWKRLARKVASVAAIAAVGTIAVPSPADANSLTQLVNASRACVLCQIAGRRILSWILLLAFAGADDQPGAAA